MQVIGPEDIKKEQYDFFYYRYTGLQMQKGETYQQILERPSLPTGLLAVYLVIDPGFVDPSILNVMGLDDTGIWRNYIRYRLQRIEFPDQEKIINWLDDFYGFTKIGIDVGPGGNGASILQGLMSRDEYKPKGYKHRLLGFNNSEAITIGMNERGEEVKKDTKGVGTEELVKQIQAHRIRFSNVDVEGTSELEKIGKQRSMNGIDRYFILSDTGKGKAASDHHYASMVVFGMLIRQPIGKAKKKLGKSRGR